MTCIKMIMRQLYKPFFKDCFRLIFYLIFSLKFVKMFLGVSKCDSYTQLHRIPCFAWGSYLVKSKEEKDVEKNEAREKGERKGWGLYFPFRGGTTYGSSAPTQFPWSWRDLCIKSKEKRRERPYVLVGSFYRLHSAAPWDNNSSLRHLRPTASKHWMIC